MAIGTSWAFSFRFGGKSSNVWDEEIAQFTIRGRDGGANRPVSGPLRAFDVAEDYTEESVTNYDIQWAHYTPGGLNADSGLGQQTMIDMAAAGYAYWQSVRAQCFSGIELQEFRIYAIGPDKKAVGGSSNKFVLKTPVAGTGNTQMPPQLAIATSLRSASRGKRGHGRFYLPWPAFQTLDSSGLISTSTRTTLANAARTLVNSINSINTFGAGDQTTDVTVAVVSLDRQDYYDVNRVAVGDVCDTIRTRRNQLPEQYTTVTL